MEHVTPKRRGPGHSGDDVTEVEAASPFDPTDLVAGGAPRGDDLTLSTAPPPLPSATVEIPVAPGTLLGDYRVGAKLGQGGMGDVFLGVHELIGKRAAIKVLRAELCADALSVERFIAEARVVNQIGHPNIVDVFAFGQTPDGRSFLVMELLEGETLRARLARAPITLAELCEIARPLVRALAAAHAKGVVHRDLKPDNVFLVAVPGEKPEVKLLDFGIAKLVRTDQQIEQTKSGALVGTPMYMSPEQVKGLGVDHRADIYTLGGMLFELATGRAPFIATTTFEVVAKHLMEPPVRPSTLAPVPRELDELIVAMLAKEPAQRPSLALIASVLEQIADPSKRVTAPIGEHERESFHSIAVTSRRPAAPIPMPEPARRRIALWLLPTLVLGAAAGAYAIVRAVSSSPERAPVIAPAPPANTPAPPPVITPRPAPAAAAVTPPPDAAVEPAPVVSRPATAHPKQGGTKRPVTRPTATGSNGANDDERLYPKDSFKPTP